MPTTVSDKPIAPAVPALEQWPLRGGAPCLDFANTVAWRATERELDGMHHYHDLIHWSRHAGFISPAESERLLQRAAFDPTGTRETLVRAVTLRAAIHRLFVALAHDDLPAADDLAAINAALAEGMPRAKITPSGAGFAYAFADEGEHLALPLWKLADSAASLLVSGEWQRVRECPGHECGWLFLDRTRNGNRRWCDSADCGNRARVRAHYQRHHTAAAATAS
ncbi:MAG: ABATE domain-containing protein [Thermomicrobiales bacterium]|nr:ABATE domain-containing protein [Thermomicrobiales bacterium]